MSDMVFVIKILVLILIFYIVMSILYWTIRNGISPAPTSIKVCKKMLDIIPEIKGNVFELGSGWGNLAIPLATRFPEAQVYAFETSLIPYLFSILWKKWSRTHNLHVFKRDIYSVDLANASLVVCYLYPGAMKKLSMKLKEELPDGSYVISNTFALPDWIPESVIEVDDIYKSKVYFYKK